MIRTWIDKFGLVKCMNAEIQLSKCLLIVRRCLNLQEEDCRSDVHAIRQGQNAVVDCKRPAEKIEYGNDSSARCDTLDEITLHGTQSFLFQV